MNASLVTIDPHILQERTIVAASPEGLRCAPASFRSRGGRGFFFYRLDHVSNDNTNVSQITTDNITIEETAVQFRQSMIGVHSSTARSFKQNMRLKADGISVIVPILKAPQ